MQIPEVVLKSGHKMPMIAMGTASFPRPPPDTLIAPFLDAIKAGYRHFDTAEFYGSEEPLGKAIKLALQSGLIESRDELYITSKVWCNHCDRHLVLPALKNDTLKRLGLEYVDLYLIHWPVRLRGEAMTTKFTEEDILPIDVKGTWEAMEECNKLGLTKSIGLSNFGIKKISQLLEHATITPAVNQVEMNAGWLQENLLKFCKAKGIHVSAWSPLGAAGAVWGSDAVVGSPILYEIAAAKGKTLAQIALRWIHEQGATVIVKSFNEERMRLNLKILNWKLNEEEVEKIKQIPQRRGFSGEIFLSSNGPYKTLEELWE